MQSTNTPASSSIAYRCSRRTLKSSTPAARESSTSSKRKRNQEASFTGMLKSKRLIFSRLPSMPTFKSGRKSTKVNWRASKTYFLKVSTNVWSKNSWSSHTSHPHRRNCLRATLQASANFSLPSNPTSSLKTAETDHRQTSKAIAPSTSERRGWCQWRRSDRSNPLISLRISRR